MSAILTHESLTGLGARRGGLRTAHVESVRWWSWSGLRRLGYLALVLVSIVILMFAAMLGYQRIAASPVQWVSFTGDAGRVDRAELERFARQISGGIGRVDLGELRVAARRIPWVREVTVRRKFPHTLEVSIEAHRAIGRWGDAHLINAFGERFAAPTEQGDLPRLVAPEGREGELVKALAGFQSLLGNAGHVLSELRLSSRGAWQVVLASGATIDLGRNDATARLEKFIAASRNMPELTRAPYVDLRHEHGFAVRHATPLTARDAHSRPPSIQR